MKRPCSRGLIVFAEATNVRTINLLVLMTWTALTARYVLTVGVGLLVEGNPAAVMQIAQKSVSALIVVVMTPILFTTVETSKRRARK